MQKTNPWLKYEQLKQEFLAKKPAPTQQQYEQFIRELARKLGL